MARDTAPMGATGLIFSIERFAVHDGPGIRVAVFFKGCPLRCWWCHSPESQSPKSEILIKEDRCLVCGSCLPQCPHHAITNAGDGFHTDRDRCEACGECAEDCPADARVLAGRAITAPELLAEVRRDRVFLDQSGGGVTFSGGEPLMQPAFLAEAIATCRDDGLHTAVETSGYGTRDAIDAAAAADLILFDLKILDDADHRRFTGVSNRIIIDNFVHLAAHHEDVRVRVPLIPGVNDDHDNLDAIGRLAARAGVSRIDLLPYHTAGIAKYDRLSRTYRLPDATPPVPKALALARRSLERFGLAVHLGG